MESALRIPFERTILNFLISNNYTHVYNKGIDTENIDSNDYFIIPLKKEDYFMHNENSPAIDLINSNDTSDMADGIDFINFIVELPPSIYERFLNT